MNKSRIKWLTAAEKEILSEALTDHCGRYYGLKCRIDMEYHYSELPDQAKKELKYADDSLKLVQNIRNKLKLEGGE